VIIDKVLNATDAATLRLYGLAVDHNGRLVSIYEARAIAARRMFELGLFMNSTWGFRARWDERMSALHSEASRKRFARGSDAPPLNDGEEPPTLALGSQFSVTPLIEG
jgi:hypothetical protein